MPYSKETKVKISKSLRGNQFAKGKNLNNQFTKGLKHTEEQKKKWSKDRIGKCGYFTHSTESEIKRLRTRIKKLEQELN